MRRSWQDAERVLCVRLDNLGDVLMTTPAMRALKQALPGRRITLLTSAAGAEAAPHIPEVDVAIRYHAPWVKSSAQLSERAADARMLLEIEREGFDAAVIFTVYSQSPLPAALMCHLAGIPLRLAHCRENPYRLLTDWVAETEPERQMRHEVQRQLDLVAAVGAVAADTGLSFRTSEKDRQSLIGKLQRAGADLSEPWIVIHPGASAASRRYPAEHYAAAARRLAYELDGFIVFSGTVAERPLVERIRREIDGRSISMAGLLSLGELGALIGGASLLIANNTGPVHIAAALGTPVVDLYALTNPQHQPWRVPSCVLYHDVPCKYCYKSVCPQGHHACLRGVAPERVVAAARELLGLRTPAAA